jgi:hypothetical protein
MHWGTELIDTEKISMNETITGLVLSPWCRIFRLVDEATNETTC